MDHLHGQQRDGRARSAPRRFLARKRRRCGLVRLNLWLKRRGWANCWARWFASLRPRAGMASEWHGMKMFLRQPGAARMIRARKWCTRISPRTWTICCAPAALRARRLCSTPWPSTSRTARRSAPRPPLICRRRKPRRSNNCARKLMPPGKVAILPTAASRFAAAADLCPQSAELQYRLARVLVAYDQPRGGGTTFSTFSGCRCAAVSGRFAHQRAAHRRRKKFAGQNLVLCDAAAALAAAAPEGVAGEESFYRACPS